MSIGKKILLKLKNQVSLPSQSQIDVKSISNSSVILSTTTTNPPSIKSQIKQKIMTSLSKPDNTQVLIAKNGHVLDPYAKNKNGSVYLDYSCTLNMTDLKDNKNKFYIMQIVQTGNTYTLMKRYGRIGEKGVIKFSDGSSPEYLISDFECTFKDKTKNNWDNRKNFVPAKGKYLLCDIDYGDDVKKVAVPKQTNYPPCHLDEQVQHFLMLVSDRNLMEESLLRLEIDPKKMPLGKISQSQLQKAYGYLKQIQKLIKLKIVSEDQLMDLSSGFYSLIPCVSQSRVSRLPSISTNDMLTKFFDVLDELSNLQIANSVLEQNKINCHPLDNIYQEINTVIKPVLPNNPMYKIIETYVTNTHGSTHTGYKIQLVNIYEIERKGEKDQYDTYCKKHNIINKMLLWHGTRLTNFISILKLGLLLRPDVIPGTYITGKMFSHGIYSANSFSKSFNYTGFDKNNTTQCLFLGEFAVGNMSPRTNADYYITEQSLANGGHNSVIGMGKNTPSSYIDVNGVTIPQGKLVKRKDSHNLSLLYDEYVVYNHAQLNLKYIVEVKAMLL